MEFIFKCSARIDAVTAFARACGVAALKDEVSDQPVEDGIFVVTIEAVLEEGTGGEGRLFGEEFKEDVA